MRLPHWPKPAQSAEVVVVGAGPGGAITATVLAQAGLDVLLVEEGPHLPVDSAPHFSLAELTQKYRNGGITVGMGRTKVAYVEGRCVGGGSEINRGLYQRTPPDVLESWRRDFHLAAFGADEMKPHFEACEAVAKVSNLPCEAPPPSRLLDEGARNLGWNSVEVPRLATYSRDAEGRITTRKQSITETFVPRFLAAGGRLQPETRVHRLRRIGGRWRIVTETQQAGPNHRSGEIVADTVFVSAGAIQTPQLLHRSGIRRNVGGTLHFHPMVKVVAQFPEVVNQPERVDPVHQVKEFEPRFSLGCSISSPATLALASEAHHHLVTELAASWRRMAIYYAQTAGGTGKVQTLPGFRDPLVRIRHNPNDLQGLASGLRRLAECLFAAGALAIYPGISGSPVLRSEADLNLLPTELPPAQTSVSTLHLFSTCRMGENERLAATDSFGKVHAADDLYVADASLLCGPTIVNPQGSIMAVAHRNAQRFLERHAAARPSPTRAA